MFMLTVRVNKKMIFLLSIVLMQQLGPNLQKAAKPLIGRFILLVSFVCRIEFVNIFVFTNLKKMFLFFCKGIQKKGPGNSKIQWLSALTVSWGLWTTWKKINGREKEYMRTPSWIYWKFVSECRPTIPCF